MIRLRAPRQSAASEDVELADAPARRLAAGRAAIPLHPEAIEGRDDQLRWILPPEVVPFTGLVGGAPDGVGEMLSAGLVAELRFEPDALLATVGSAHSWRDVGSAFRSAVVEALANPSGWSPRPDDGAPDGSDPGPSVNPIGRDLLAVARQVIDGAGGDEIRSHGGTVELIEVTGDEVVVRLGGACTGCPAADATLHYRLEAAIRARHPQLIRVRRVSGRTRHLRPDFRRW